KLKLYVRSSNGCAGVVARKASVPSERSSIRNMTSGASAIACTPRMVPLPEAVGRSDSVQAASKAVQSTAAIRRREVVVIVVLFIRRSAVAADRACGREFRPRGPAQIGRAHV